MSGVGAKALSPDEEMTGEGDEEVRCDEGAPQRIGAGGDEREVKRLGDPRRPTEAEVEDHERTHLPYRN